MPKQTAIPAPKGKWFHFFTNLSLYDVLIAFAALMAAVGAAYLSYGEVYKNKRDIGYLVFGTAFVMFVANIVKAILQWRERSEKQSTHELEGCLFTLFFILMEPLGATADETGFRITIHVPKGDGQNLVQVIDYVGSQRKTNRKGQITPIACGITGRAFRVKGEVRLKRADSNYENYLNEIMANQGYTRQQAEKLDPSTMSGYAYPIFDNQQVLGIVYADATNADFFTEERINIIQNACVGIARFVGQKYKV